MFTKYPRIENHYQEQSIQRFMREFPDLMDEEVYIEEKLHGANISLMSTKTGVQWFKRNGPLKPKENFYGIWDVIPKYKDLENVIHYGQPGTQVYFEFIGPGIQKGVNYGDEKRLVPIDFKFANMGFASPAEFHHLFEWLPDKVRLLGIKKLKDALEFDTRITNEYGSLIEGVVIKPKSFFIYSHLGERFLLKKKNKEFFERMPKEKPPKDVDYTEANKIADLYSEYLTPQRVQSVFSKEGTIENINQLGQYLSLISNDAWEDFEAEHGEIDRKMKRYANKINNSKIIEMLKEHL